MGMAPRDSTSYCAKRCDEYCIQAPEEAWALLPRQAFLVTLMSCTSGEDGQLCVKVVTLGGGEMEFQLAEGTAVHALMQLVAEERQLGADVAVHVIAADGTPLELDS